MKGTFFNSAVSKHRFNVTQIQAFITIKDSYRSKLEKIASERVGIIILLVNWPSVLEQIESTIMQYLVCCSFKYKL